jgi:hypothetical protein
MAYYVPSNRPDVPGQYILRVVAGSQAYGTNTPESDLDIRGIFIPNEKYHIGFQNVEQVEDKKDGNDTVIYALKKYIKQAATQASPNSLEIIYSPEDCIIETGKYYDELYKNRHLFLSKKIRYSYIGYAYSQIKRIETHRRWLLNPQKSEPNREDFGLPKAKSLINREQIGAFYVLLSHLLKEIAELNDLYDAVQEALCSEDFPGWEGIVQSRGIPDDALPVVKELVEASDNFIHALQKEQAYHRQLSEWKKYQEWLRTRNPKRAELEKKFGFDTKHASHLVRLIFQGEELLKTGNLSVRLKNADQVKNIKSGIWLDDTQITYDKVKEFLNTKEESFKKLYKECTILPEKPPMNKIEEIYMNMVRDYLGG